ncbi:hypothetical protein F0562_012228 [Nyssa sinensis]|uniref:Uncharacterized protein n=1 Tax=Nyssa sinensis TaxID=561372 RepID=A0A5J4ZS58_9ASTE|nr:hypothetical protein F0562_012228 [Nyssa sinensis]
MDENQSWVLHMPELRCDNDFLKMMTYVPPSRVIEVYLEHVSPMDFLHSQIGSSNAGSSHVVIEKIDFGEDDYSIDIETQRAIVKGTKGINLWEDNEVETEDSKFIDSDYCNSDDDELFEKNVDEEIEWGGLSRSRGEGKGVNVEAREGVDSDVN